MVAFTEGLSCDVLFRGIARFAPVHYTAGRRHERGRAGDLSFTQHPQSEDSTQLGWPVQPGPGPSPFNHFTARLPLAHMRPLETSSTQPQLSSTQTWLQETLLRLPFMRHVREERDRVLTAQRLAQELSTLPTQHPSPLSTNAHLPGSDSPVKR
ncbi:hypothetical protein HaLaN_22634 [Haematococcus lacustris]|uniref:Uncharacterized protein n=1 Tax=Haematococcus lacustris TaxID=44745 RepID=A0A699ZU93_HAELA|nr:hypothetical protein HaLaN_22634 [Haematococcus lacustris]